MNADAACADVDADTDCRVRISVSKRDKHTLPVDNDCPWWRPNSIVSPTQHYTFGCTTFKGKDVENYSDLIGCLQEADCETTGTAGVCLRGPSVI